MPRGRKSPESAKKPDPEIASEGLQEEQLEMLLPELEDQIAQRTGKAEEDVQSNGDQLAMLEDMEMDLLLEDENDSEKPHENNNTSETSILETSDVLSATSIEKTDSNKMINETSDEKDSKEAIATGSGQLRKDINELSETEPENLGEKAGEIAEERTNEIEESFGDIIEVTRDEEGNVMSDVDNYKNEETGEEGMDALYEDLLKAESIDDPANREKEVQKVKDKIEKAVGDKDKAEKIYEKASEDENMTKYYNALFMKKLQLINEIDDPDLKDKARDILRGDAPPSEKLKQIDRLFEEASEKYEEVRKLHGLSKKIDKKLGVPSLIDAYVKAKEKGINSSELEKALDKLREVASNKLDLERQPDAYEGLRIMAINEAPVLASQLIGGNRVEYMGNGEFKSELENGNTIFVEVDMANKKVKDSYFKYGEKKVDVKNTHPNEAIGINEALGKLMAYQIGADSIAEDDFFTSELTKDIKDRVMNKEDFTLLGEKIGALLTCNSKNLKISSKEANTRFIDLGIKGNGSVKQLFSKYLEWLGNQASTAGEMRTLRMSLKPEDLETLSLIWTKNEDGSLKSKPTFDTTIKLEKIRSYRENKLK